MSELAAPMTSEQRARLRLEQVEGLSAQIARLESLRRLELAALAAEQSSFGFQDYLADELALALAESCGTARRLLETSVVYADFPSVVGRVGLPLSEGGWSTRHADALLDSIVGLGLTARQQQQVVDLVASHPDARTPHQVRKAAQAAVMILDPEAAARRFERAKKDRHVSSQAWGDGKASFCAQGTASQVAMVMASLDALAGPKQPGETRTLDQRRFDAFMDLICGRTRPGQWQALIVVALETLEGAQRPAEVPGFGLVCAQEAAEALAQAELRRALVDEHGRLVSVDSRVHRPDQTDPVLLDPAHPDAGVSLEREPQPLDSTPEDLPSDDDTAWHQQHLDQPDTRPVERLVADAMSGLEHELAILLRAATLVSVGAATGRLDLRFGPWDQGPSGPGEPDDGDPPGPQPPPESEPPPHDEPQRPSFDDLSWAEQTQDREAQDAQEPPPRFEREPRTRGEQPRRSSSWSLPALTAAHRRLRTTAADQRPMTSTGYALPPRLARFIKTRDVTCTFPVCTLLAQRCQNDHLDPYPAGRTTAHNTSSECTHHHQAKHAAFTVRRTPDGGLDWTTRHGRTYHRSPRPLLRGW